MLQLSIFLTNLGWFGLLREKQQFLRLTIGHASADRIRMAIQTRDTGMTESHKFIESDWNPRLRSCLQKYAQGRNIDFDDVKVPLGQRSQFQQQVLAIARTIKYGQTVTYGELACLSGSPRAARAVGSVMAANPFPIIVPCHRVVAFSGKIGGYSASQGVSLKARMLEIEAKNCSQKVISTIVVKNNLLRNCK